MFCVWLSMLCMGHEVRLSKHCLLTKGEWLSVFNFRDWNQKWDPATVHFVISRLQMQVNDFLLRCNSPSISQDIYKVFTITINPNARLCVKIYPFTHLLSLERSYLIWLSCEKKPSPRVRVTSCFVRHFVIFSAQSWFFKSVSFQV